MGLLMVLIIFGIFFVGAYHGVLHVREVQKYYPDYGWYDNFFGLELPFENEELNAALNRLNRKSLIYCSLLFLIFFGLLILGHFMGYFNLINFEARQ